jgi:DNA ligase (NAD+)
MSLWFSIRASIHALPFWLSLLVLFPACFDAPFCFASENPDARIEQLRAEIKRHDELYYKKASPEISDTAYDALKRELRELEAAHPALATADSPTRRVDDDAPDTFFRHHPHRAPMLSLDNTYTETDICAFDQRVRKQLAARATSAALPAPRYTIEPKIDGAGISLVYERGKLVRILTRGDGSGGDDIIANTRAISELPQQLRDDGGGLPELVEIRGEIYMAFADFERINEQRAAAGQPLFANPRNLAAGTMKLHDSAEVANRALHVFVYGVGVCEPGAAMRAPITTQHDLLERFRAWGLPVIEKYWLADTPVALVAAIAELSELRTKLAYPIDGAVVKVDDFASQQILGSHATAPRWAIAYKYTPKSVETRVRAITLQVGRTGALTPVAELDPVAFAGSKISRVTLHNTQELLRKDVRAGDVVVIEKAGDIIPEIARVKIEARAANSAAPAPFALPENCPECATSLVAENDAANHALLCCPNHDCPAQVKARIAYFASKACVNIAGLGDSTVGKLVSQGLVRDAAGLYDLTPRQISTLDGFGEKSAARLHAAIAASRRAELWRVLVGLGMPDVATSRAKTLAKHFDSLAALASADEAAIARLPGVGKKAAANIAAWLADPSNRAMVGRIEKHRAGSRRSQ